MDAKALKEQADQLFGKRASLLLLWQEIAENFYPERADFTLRRALGTDFASYLHTSYPVMVRRDLGDQLSAMLRPTAKQWFHTVPKDVQQQDHEAKQWLESATGAMRRAMYDPVSQFARATKEGDHDFATFGQCAISAQLNRHAEHLLFRCWHLRDMAWMENQDGEVHFVARRWKPTCRDLCALFPGKVDRKIEAMKSKEPFREVEVLHIVCEAEMYDADARGKPRWSIFYDCENNAVIESVATFDRVYIIPRWQTVSGSQYAFSPATVAGLPDARLLQSMTLTLMEAGEQAVKPPMIATTDVVRSDIALYAGGVTWVDRDYDEKLGEALRPINQEFRGIPIGQDMLRDTRSMLMQAFYLNKLNLPQRAPEMTAYEVGQRVQEYIRGAMPLFEPMEMSYNGQLCEEVFGLMLRNGGFGSPLDMPESLHGTETQFQFESPLHDAIEQQRGQKFLEMKSLLAEAASVDANAAAVPDVITAFRDALSGIGIPAKWVRSEDEANRVIQQTEQARQASQLLAQMQQGAEVAEKLGAAQKNTAQAQTAGFA